MISSTHNHSTGSDGKLSPEEVIKKAIELGWNEIYFTDHYFAANESIDKSYNYSRFFKKEYISEIKKLKEKYKDKIEVFFGVEFNWAEDYPEWTKKEIKKENYDYVIGSVHELFDKNKEVYGIERGIDNWKKSAEAFGGIEKFVEEYYKQIKLMIKSGFFDSVAHFDYIKIHNKNEELFSEKADWYKKDVSEVLDLLKKSKMALEINHGGIRKCGEQFPSSWIIKEAKKRSIPITLGLDMHREDHFNNEFMNQLIDIAKKAGYKEVVRFKNRKMIKEKLK